MFAVCCRYPGTDLYVLCLFLCVRCRRLGSGGGIYGKLMHFVVVFICVGYVLVIFKPCCACCLVDSRKQKKNTIVSGPNEGRLRAFVCGLILRLLTARQPMENIDWVVSVDLLSPTYCFVVSVDL